MHSSKTMYFCDKCGTPSKIGRKISENGEKLRYCKHCGETIDIVKKAK